MEAKVIITTELQLKAIVADAVNFAFKYQLAQIPTSVDTPTDVAPILNAKQVKNMTGWPNGTFYQKVNQMPEGVVIRGKSKRLLFDRVPIHGMAKNTCSAMSRLSLTSVIAFTGLTLTLLTTLIFYNSLNRLYPLNLLPCNDNEEADALPFGPALRDAE